MRIEFQLTIGILSWIFSSALQMPHPKPAFTRRSAIETLSVASTAIFLPKSSIIAAAQEELSYDYENRDRKKNKDALIREDYWYFSGKKPPRRLDIDAFPANDPTWNAWGECTKSEVSGNSCVYVSLKQRIPAYGKYAYSISYGANDFAKLGKILKSSSEQQSTDWNAAAQLVDPGVDTRMPSPTVDALLKMALFATQMLTSPNYTGPSRELLVSRYYINECAFAIGELAKAIDERDLTKALGLWEFGKDSWNSYSSIVNRAIVPKVGDKFEMIA